jgi:hypothetical protein
VITPADSVAEWASSSTLIVQFVVSITATFVFVIVGIRWARRAGRQV